MRQRSPLERPFIGTSLDCICRNFTSRFYLLGIHKCDLSPTAKTALSLLGAIGLDRMCIDQLCAKGGNFKFQNIVTDASEAIKLAAKLTKR